MILPPQGPKSRQSAEDETRKDAAGENPGGGADASTLWLCVGPAADRGGVPEDAETPSLPPALGHSGVKPPRRCGRWGS